MNARENTMGTTTLRAWNTVLGLNAEIEVPTNRSESVVVVSSVPILQTHHYELCRGARSFTECPGAISCTTDSGWVISQ